MLARFERLVEQAVEGSLRRVFPTTVQPVQLAKAAARAMEDAQVIGLHGAEVPNKYDLQLSPDDLERFGDYAGALCDELSRYLADYARERGLRPVAAPVVELRPDPSVRSGSATDNDVVIANQRVSRYHAQLRWVESSWLVYDLDSTNGTWLDGQRVFPSQPRVLGAGSVLRLGDHELRAADE